MKSQIIKRSVVIAGRKTSVSVEDAFWSLLGEIAAIRSASVAGTVEAVDVGRPAASDPSSAIRLVALAEAVKKPREPR